MDTLTLPSPALLADIPCECTGKQTIALAK